MNIPTLLRQAEHRALKDIELTGSVLDLGGDARSDYRSFFRGSPSYTTVNLDTKAKPDIFHDLEKPLPIEDASYDHVVLINVLEHVYEYRQLIEEAVRVVRPGGSIIIVVPFLFPIHPSPKDYWRFSADTLERLCADAGLSDVRITPLGTGVFAAQYVMLDRLLPFPLRLLGFYTFRPLALLSDWLWTRMARALGKAYRPADYAIGYCVRALR